MAKRWVCLRRLPIATYRTRSELFLQKKKLALLQMVAKPALTSLIVLHSVNRDLQAQEQEKNDQQHPGDRI